MLKVYHYCYYRNIENSMYKQEVDQNHGMCFGNKDQSNFNSEVNTKNKGLAKNIVQTLSSHFLKRLTFQSWDILDRRGVCNGLVQALYKKLYVSKDKLQALQEFASQIDTGDLTLAKNVAFLQSVSGDKYEKSDHDHFFKTLGLFFEDEKCFYPYENSLVKKYKQGLQKIKLFFPDAPINNEQPPPDSKAILDNLLTYVCQQPVGDLVKLTLNFTKNNVLILSEGINGHAIFFSKMINTDGSMLYIFYDPNQRPTVFFKQEDFINFAKKYLDTTINEFKAGLGADDANFIVSTHSNISNFPTVMRELEKAIEALESSVSSEIQEKLKILKLKCIYAEKYGMQYEPSSPTTTDDSCINQILSNIKKNTRTHYCNKDLHSQIQIYIQQEIPPSMAADFLNILNGYQKANELGKS